MYVILTRETRYIVFLVLLYIDLKKASKDSEELNNISLYQGLGPAAHGLNLFCHLLCKYNFIET